MANTMFNIGTGMTGGVMPNPISLSTEIPIYNTSVSNMVDRVFDLTSNPNLYFKNMSTEIDFSSVGASLTPKSQILMASDAGILDSNQQDGILQNIILEQRRQNITRMNDILSKTPTIGNGNRYAYPSIKTTNQNFNTNLISYSSINVNRYSYPRI